MKSFTLLLTFALCCNFAFGQNHGLSFNGSDENLIIDHKPIFNIQNQFTIEAWIYANEWKAELWRGSIVNKDGQGPDAGYAFRCGADGVLSFVMSVNNVWQELFTTPIMNAKQWHHVAVVVDNGNMSLYLDGQPIISSTYDGPPTANDNDVYIGASPGFGDRNFDGLIDEVRIWNIARTSQEIADNTTHSFAGNEAGLIAYFPMNEGSGMQAGNLVDGNCNAQFFNMDESNWGEGYVIPDFDVSPSRISGLDVINLDTRPIRINVDILNSGAQSVSNFPLEVYIDDELVLTENYTSTIPPGQLVTHSFFTPVDLTTYNNPKIEIQTKLADDGNLLNNSTSIDVSSPMGNIIRLFDGVQHSFGGDGRTHNASVVLPADLSNYEQMLLHISLACPSTGCDPWDQPAKIEAITDQGTFEIARYITPYGIACGPWMVDVTDFKSVLGGSVDFRSFIQVWGNSGWLVTLDLELIEGNSTQPFSKLSQLWGLDYLVYGDPGINDDLPPVAIQVDDNTESSHIRMTISGHGQANTNNAAEFYNVTHDFIFNNAVINNHNVWKPDCEFNPCANQAGNWLFDRAGWCPGQEVAPYTVNTTGQANAGANISLDYDLQDYTNLLNTGYNGSSHTEPHYRIWSFFVENSSNRYSDYFNMVCDSVSAEVSGMGAAQTLDKLSIYLTNSGSQSLSDIKVSYFINNNFIVEEDIPGTIDAGASYVHDFEMLDGFSPDSYNKVYAIVSQISDQNSGDNISREEINPELVPTEELFFVSQLNIYPNPSADKLINLDFGDQTFDGEYIIYDQAGKIVQRRNINSSFVELRLENNGLYFLQLKDNEGRQTTRKLVVHSR